MSKFVAMLAAVIALAAGGAIASHTDASHQLNTVVTRAGDPIIPVGSGGGTDW